MPIMKDWIRFPNNEGFLYEGGDSTIPEGSYLQMEYYHMAVTYYNEDVGLVERGHPPNDNSGYADGEFKDVPEEDRLKAPPS